MFICSIIHDSQDMEIYTHCIFLLILTSMFPNLLFICISCPFIYWCYIRGNLIYILLALCRGLHFSSLFMGLHYVSYCLKYIKTSASCFLGLYWSPKPLIHVNTYTNKVKVLKQDGPGSYSLKITSSGVFICLKKTSLFHSHLWTNDTFTGQKNPRFTFFLLIILRHFTWRKD